MPAIGPHFIDRNGDGFVDDATTRILADPAPGVDEGDFWSKLLDIGAYLGLNAQALPLPLFLSAPPGSDSTVLTVRTIEDVDALQIDLGVASEGHSATGPAADNSPDLLDLFSISGLLDDRDGDLLPDATRFSLTLPESVPANVGVALCNFAVRIGLETGGVVFPIVSDGDTLLRIEIGDGPARLSAEDGGWLAEGTAPELALLFERIAQDWPTFGHPETAGARAGIDHLAATLAGDKPRSPDDAEVVWELQWSAQPEVERLVESVQSHLLPKIAAASAVELVVFACEPRSVRLGLERTLTAMIEARDVRLTSIHVLSAFKTGLSWLQEIVLPELEGRDVRQLDVRYRRYEPTGERAHLDMPIRWLQELFPGDEIAAEALGISIDDIHFLEDQTADAPTYRATATGPNGEIIGTWELETLSYSMPFMPNIEGSDLVEVTTGGFVADVDGVGVERRVDTDLDRFWKFWQDEALRRVIAGIARDGGFHAHRQPFFGTLEAEVWLSSPNSRLGVREENDSAAEALHEDIYFNTLDTIEVLGADSTGDKTSAPGAVIPIVHVQEGIAPHAIVRLREAPQPGPARPKLTVRALMLDADELVATVEGPFEAHGDAAEQLARSTDDARSSFAADLLVDGRRLRVRLPLPDVLTADSGGAAPPMDENIHGGEVGAWSARVGQAEQVSAWIEGHSYQGRPIQALALRSPAPGRVWSATKLAVLKPTALIVARHHANEISSTNAAFNLAHLVGTDPDWADLVRKLNIVIIPYENADGAALHARLAGSDDARTWKHHPARYNALGHEFGEDYFKPETPFGEARVRPALWRRWLPDAIVDNHGVPSHEWIQPFAGFGSPPRFRVSYWVPQALIYGISRYVDDPAYPAHREAALALRDTVSAAVRDTPIGDLNREIGASYRRWGQERVPERFPGESHGDMLWHFGGTPLDADGRGFNVRYPRTTVLSWVTEVNDETANGEHLKIVAEAHLIANRAMLDLLVDMDVGAEATASQTEGGKTLRQFRRARPLRRR